MSFERQSSPPLVEDEDTEDCRPTTDEKVQTGLIAVGLANILNGAQAYVQDVERLEIEAAGLRRELATLGKELCRLQEVDEDVDPSALRDVAAAAVSAASRLPCFGGDHAGNTSVDGPIAGRLHYEPHLQSTNMMNPLPLAQAARGPKKPLTDQNDDDSPMRKGLGLTALRRSKVGHLRKTSEACRGRSKRRLMSQVRSPRFGTLSSSGNGAPGDGDGGAFAGDAGRTATADDTAGSNLQQTEDQPLLLSARGLNKSASNLEDQPLLLSARGLKNSVSNLEEDGPKQDAVVPLPSTLSKRGSKSSLRSHMREAHCTTLHISSSTSSSEDSSKPERSLPAPVSALRDAVKKNGSQKNEEGVSPAVVAPARFRGEWLKLAKHVKEASNAGTEMDDCKELTKISSVLTAGMRMANSSKSGSFKATFSVEPIWLNPPKDTKLKNKKSNIARSTERSEESIKDDEFGTGMTTSRCKPFHPSSKCVVIWEFCRLGWTLWDLFAVPMDVFSPASTPSYAAFYSVISWFSGIFWVMDVFVSASTGYIRYDGYVYMGWGKILRRYLSTWFAYDLMIVFQLWLEHIFRKLPDTSGFVGTVRDATITARWLRLIRLVRVFDIIFSLFAGCDGGFLGVALDVGRHIFFITCLSHVMGCGWYQIGNLSKVTGDFHWFEATKVPGSDQSFDQASLSYRYISVLQWSLCQWTGGMDEIKATNTMERFYSVASWMLGYVWSAICISSFTTAMTNAQVRASEANQKLATLQKYLDSHGIGHALAVRVRMNATYLLEQERQLEMLGERQGDLLQRLTGKLRKEIKFEVCLPVVRDHPFFGQFARESKPMMENICFQAMATVFVAKGEEIFHIEDEKSPCSMVWVAEGELLYRSIFTRVVKVGFSSCIQLTKSRTTRTTTCDEMESAVEKTSAHWISEAFLWTTWEHRGCLHAMSNSRVLSCDPTCFRKIASQFVPISPSQERPVSYAKRFVKELNKLSEVDDLAFPVPDDDVFCAKASTHANNIKKMNTWRPLLARTAHLQPTE